MESVVDVGVGAAEEVVSLSSDGAMSSVVVASVKRRLDDSTSVSSSEGEGLRFSVDDMSAVVSGIGCEGWKRKIECKVAIQTCRLARLRHCWYRDDPVSMYNFFINHQYRLKSLRYLTWVSAIMHSKDD